jgi:hypothetical protein
MREIASLLSAQRDLGTLDLLLKRVQVEESRLGRATDRLQVISSERRVLETAKAPVEAKLEVLAAQLDQISTGPHPELEVMSAQLQEELRRIRLRLAGLAEEASVLENEVGRRREELAAWQNLVDRRLKE